MAHTILLRCSERVTKFHPGSEGKRSQRRSIMGYAAVRSYQSPQALKRKRVLQFGIPTILAAVALLVFWGVDWQWGKTSEAAPHLEERTAPEMAQGSHASGQSDGLKISANLGPIGVSGSPKEVGETLMQGMQGLAEVANDVDNYLKDQARRQRERKEMAQEFKAKVRKAMEVRRTDRAFWETLPKEVRFQLLVGMSYEQKGFTEEQRKEFLETGNQLVEEIGRGATANLQVFAMERYGQTGPRRESFFKNIIASR